jgi:hypothetical protein
MIALALLLAADLGSTVKSIKQDGPVALSEEAQREIVSLLPASRKGEQCPEPAKVSPEAQGLKDRGDGTLLVVAVASCKGGRLFAISPGSPIRIARLADLSEGETLRSIKALSLAGGRRESDLALELSATHTTTELRLFARRDTGFGFSDSGTLREYAAVRECSQGGEEGSGWNSYLRSEKDRLAVLRIDGSCGSGPWQASCVLYRAERDQLSKSGVCALPQKLEAKSLKASGWK